MNRSMEPDCLSAEEGATVTRKLEAAGYDTCFIIGYGPWTTAFRIKLPDKPYATIIPAAFCFTLNEVFENIIQQYEAKAEKYMRE